MILRLPSVQWVVIASILALLIAWLLQSQILLSQLKGKPRSLTFYEELRLQIDQIRYNTSDIRLKTLFPSSRNFKSSTPSLASVSINSVADALTRVKDRKPFLFKSPEILSWKLLTSDVWDLAYRWPLLTAVLQLKVDIKRHIDSRLMPLFIAEIEPPEGGVLGVAQEAGRPEVTDEMLFAHLLLQLKIDENKFFYSTNFRIMERIVNFTNSDINWRLLLYDEGFAADSNITADAAPPQFWLLSPNSALQTRYSPSHTMRVQLFGHTRCILYPPDNAKYLHLYPSIHVSDKQSQVDIYQENMRRQMKTVDEESDVDNSVETETESDFPRFKKAQGRVVDLSPGEVLYIPPYWLVLTESADTELSVGLDVVSVSREQVVLAEGYAMSLPFRNFSNATKQERVLATQVFLVNVLSRVEGMRSPLLFSKALYEARFADSYPENGLYLQRHRKRMQSGFDCYREDNDLKQRVGSSLDRDLILQGARFVAAHVNNPVVPSAVRWLWLGDYSEQLARWAMGSPEEAILFLRECLDQPQKLNTTFDDQVEVQGPPVMKMGSEHYKDVDHLKQLILEDLKSGKS